MNYITALSMDMENGILDDTSAWPPDLLLRNPYMFKAKTNFDPDTPNIREMGNLENNSLRQWDLKWKSLRDMTPGQ
jgi:hypothetical protein